MRWFVIFLFVGLFSFHTTDACLLRDHVDRVHSLLRWHIDLARDDILTRGTIEQTVRFIDHCFIVFNYYDDIDEFGCEDCARHLRARCWSKLIYLKTYIFS